MSWLTKKIINPLSRLFRKQRDRLLEDVPALLRRLPLDEAEQFVRDAFSYLPPADIALLILELAPDSPLVDRLRAALEELPVGALQGMERRLKEKLKRGKR